MAADEKQAGGIRNYAKTSSEIEAPHHRPTSVRFPSSSLSGHLRLTHTLKMIYVKDHLSADYI